MIGCAYNHKDINDQRICESQMVGDTSSKQIKTDTQVKKEFYEPTQLKGFSGIESANLNSSNLSLMLVDKGYFEQYSSPVVNTMLKVNVDAHPLLSPFLLPFAFIPVPPFGPIAWAKFTFGCTDIWPLPTEADTTRKVKTGKSEWKNVQKNHRILITGFDKNYEFVVDNKGLPNSNQAVIDLSSAILNTELTKNTTLKISCMDCDLLGPQEQSLYKDSKTSIELSNDFRPIKLALIESKQSKFAEGEKDKIRKQGVNLEEFKTQCELLGFKADSTDFGNCVLELNGAK